MVAPWSNIAPVARVADPLRPDATPGLESFQTEGGPNVINNLRVPGEQQVMLRVMVAEVNRAAAREMLTHWKTDPDLAGLRDPVEIAKVPETERTACHQFWAKVDLLLRDLAFPENPFAKW